MAADEKATERSHAIKKQPAAADPLITVTLKNLGHRLLRAFLDHGGKHLQELCLLKGNIDIKSPHALGT